MHQSDELIPLLLGEKVECKFVKIDSSEHMDQDDWNIPIQHTV